MSLRHWRAKQFVIAAGIALVLTFASMVLDHRAAEEKPRLPAGVNKSQVAPIDIDGFMRSSDTNHAKR